MSILCIKKKSPNVFYLDRRLLESQLAVGLPVILVGYHVFGNHFVQPEITVGHGFHMNTFSLGRPLQLVSITIVTHDAQTYTYMGIKLEDKNNILLFKLKATMLPLKCPIFY